MYVCVCVCVMFRLHVNRAWSSFKPYPLISSLSQLTTVKAQCVYLRAFYQLCHHEILNALDNFFDTLQRLEVSLVPDYKYVIAV